MKLLIAFVLGLSLNLYAHDHHGHRHPKSHHQESRGSDHDPDMRELLQFFHDAILGSHEGEHSHGLREAFGHIFEKETWKGFVENLNPVRVGTNSMRAYFMAANSQKRVDMAKDFVFIFPLSHAVEMTFGPALGIAANNLGLGALWSTAVGLVGSVIAVPGFDPVCIMIFSSYFASPQVRASVSFLRKGVTRGIFFVLNRVQDLPWDLMNRSLNRSIQENARPWTIAISNQNANEFTMTYRDARLTSVLTLEGRHASGRFEGDRGENFVTKMTWTGENIPSSALMFLPWNVRQAFRAAKKDLAKSVVPERFYVQSQKKFEKGWAAEFSPHSVPIRPRIWSQMSGACAHLAVGPS